MTWRSHRPFGCLALAYLATASALLIRFPPVNPDEILAAVSSRNFYHGQGVRYSLNDDIFAPSAYGLRDLSNLASRKLYMAWCGAWALSRNPSVTRASSVAAGLGILLFFYAFGVAVRDPPFGLVLAASFLINPIFWAISLVINEHILLLAGMGLVLWLSTVDPVKFPRALAFSGLISGLLFAVHPNIALFIPGWMVFVLCTHRNRSRSWLLGHAVSGLTIGALVSFLLVDWPRFLQFQKTIYWGLTKPPLLTFPWSPAGWIYSFFSSLFNGPTFAFNTEAAPGWSWSLRFFWAALSLAAMAAFLPANQEASGCKPGGKRGLGLAFLLTLSLMIAIVRRTEVCYAVVLFPFLAPLAVLGLRQTSPFRRPCRIAVAVLLSVSFFFLMKFMVTYRSRYTPYDRILSEVNGLITQPAGKVAGPAVLWFGFPDDRFRDIGAVVVSRYYTEGYSNLNQWLGRWKPDILITDNNFRRIFRIPPADEAALGKLLGVPAHLKGLVNTGVAAWTLEIYDLNWTKTGPA